MYIESLDRKVGDVLFSKPAPGVPLDLVMYRQGAQDYRANLLKELDLDVNLKKTLKA